MADKLPEWATTPRDKHWLVKVRSESDERTEVAVDDKPGLLIGRNGQVNERNMGLIHFSLHPIRDVTVDLLSRSVRSRFFTSLHRVCTPALHSTRISDPS